MSCDHYYYRVSEHFITLEKTPYTFSSIQLLSHVQLFVTLWIAAHQASLVLHSLLEFAQTHVHWAGDTIQPSHPLSFPSPPAFSLSQHQGLYQ